MPPDIPGRRIEWFDSIDYTMIRAAALARERCPHGTIVGADEQTAGVGRQGRSWHSKKGEGLYVSMVLRLPVESRALPVVMLALGLAAQEAIAQTASLAPDLRWPNDVLLGGKKCAGILAQLEGDAIIAGIGMNVHHAAFPDEIRDLATSLALEGAHVGREGLLIALALAIDEHMELLRHPGPATVRQMFT